MPAQQARLQRLLVDFVEALGDGRITPEEGTDLLKQLAGLVPARKLFNKGVDFVIDKLHRDEGELRQAAQAKRDRARELEEELQEELEETGGSENRRTTRLRRKIEDRLDDAQDFEDRADALAADDDGPEDA